MVEGVDRLTGLAVLVHGFAGTPHPKAEALDSDHTPGVLAATSDAEGGLLVAALARDYAPLTSGAELGAPEAEALLGALRDAERAGVPHGDLQLGNVWRAPDGPPLVSGFGVPWRDDPTTEADRARAAALLREHGRGLPHGLSEALSEAQRDPGAWPPEALLARLFAAPAPPAPAAPGGEEPEPLTVEDEAAPAEPAGPDFIKDVPPGGAYRSGAAEGGLRPGAFDVLADEEEAPRRSSRLALLLAVLVVVAGAAAGLTWWGGTLSEEEDATAATSRGHVVEVRVTPQGAPPLDVVVVDAPSGSELSPGTRLGRAPRSVLLDRPGRWVLQGRVDGERSEAATFVVPDERVVALHWPFETP